MCSFLSQRLQTWVMWQWAANRETTAPPFYLRCRVSRFSLILTFMSKQMKLVKENQSMWMHSNSQTIEYTPPSSTKSFPCLYILLPAPIFFMLLHIISMVFHRLFFCTWWRHVLVTGLRNLQRGRRQRWVCWPWRCGRLGGGTGARHRGSGRSVGGHQCARGEKMREVWRFSAVLEVNMTQITLQQIIHRGKRNHFCGGRNFEMFLESASDQKDVLWGELLHDSRSRKKGWGNLM